MTQKSYAQFDTDLHILSLFPDGYIGTYIDIGASHPITGSNTYLLYEKGWRGICIEPTDKTLLYATQRQHDVALQVAVGQHDGQITFYQCLEDTVSTVLPSEAEKRGNYVCKTIEIKTLSTILRSLYILTAFPWDVLSIDTEGYEKEVLEGCPFDSGFRPKVIVLEGYEPCTEIPCWDNWEHILCSYGYMYVKTVGVNRFYKFKTRKIFLDN